MNRNLDGLFFRIQRDGKWTNVCFSDLTVYEREQVCEGKSAEWLKNALFYVTDCLRGIGEEFDLVGVK